MSFSRRLLGFACVFALVLPLTSLNAQQRSAAKTQLEIAGQLGTLTALRDKEVKLLQEFDQEFRKANAEHEVSKRELAKAKKNAEDEAESSPSLKATRDQADKVRQKQIDLRRQIVVELRKSRSEYRDLADAQAKSLAEMKRFSGADAQESRRLAARKAGELDKKLKAIEEAAMNDSADAKALKSELKEADAEVASEFRKMKLAIEQNASLTSAKTGFQRSRDALKAAKDNIAGCGTRMAKIDNQMRSLAALGQSLNGEALRESQREGSKSGYTSGGSSCGNCGFQSHTLAINQRCPHCGVLFKSINVRSK